MPLHFFLFIWHTNWAFKINLIFSIQITLTNNKKFLSLFCLAKYNSPSLNSANCPALNAKHQARLNRQCKINKGARAVTRGCPVFWGTTEGESAPNLFAADQGSPPSLHFLYLNSNLKRYNYLVWTGLLSNPSLGRVGNSSSGLWALSRSVLPEIGVMKLWSPEIQRALTSLAWNLFF